MRTQSKFKNEAILNKYYNLGKFNSPAKIGYMMKMIFWKSTRGYDANDKPRKAKNLYRVSQRKPLLLLDGEVFFCGIFNPKLLSFSVPSPYN